MISYVFYAHLSRLENLRQTIYALKKREPSYHESQKIIVFQNGSCEIEGCEIYDLKLETYNKSKMCNFGVSKVSNHIVALLDSDRILPPCYFSENAKVITKNQMITAKSIIKFNKDVPYDFMTHQNYQYTKELRSETNVFGKKNLFSGNTMFFKETYDYLGGMDESFFGYGYADNDMTQKVISRNIKQIFRDLNEYHLNHEPTVCYKGVFFKDYQIFCGINIMKYCIKWEYSNKLSQQILDEVFAKINTYPEELQKQFIELYKQFKDKFL